MTDYLSGAGTACILCKHKTRTPPIKNKERGNRNAGPLGKQAEMLVLCDE